MSRICYLIAFFVGVISSAANAQGPAMVPSGFADLSEQTLPAVVNISTKQKPETKNAVKGKMPEIPALPPGSPFEDFFEQFQEFYGAPQDREAVSLGSGFIIDPSGYIVTNNHVVADAAEITVTFRDETKSLAKLIGRDPKTDVALLKVESKKPLPALRWGDSDVARVGDWVIAIGSPFGFDSSVSAGIISARARDINSGPFDDFIQTDAAINRGNSGGPLLNMKGEVIGMNTAIFSPTGVSIGIGFAVPANMAHNVIEQIKKFGRPKRGWLGVRIQTVTDEMAESLQLQKTQGALVAEVTANSPAAKAGIVVGDVILRFDGQEIGKMRQLPRIVAATASGKKVEMVLLREGKEKRISIVVADMPAEQQETAANDSAPNNNDNSATSVAGLSLADISDEWRKRLNLSGTASGVVITDVVRGSAAAKAGLQPADIILSVQQQSLNKATDAVAAIKALEKKNKSALLLVERGGTSLFVALALKAE
jgi:serine protease Do